jgi:peroxiredoxin
MAALISPGAPAPDFTLPGLDGRRYHLAERGGRIIILNFWSAECPWSERADTEILASLLKWGAQVLYWPIAANRAEPLEQQRQVAESRGLPQLLLDSDQQVADLYQAQTTPHFFVVDGNGILAYQGALDDVTFRRREPTRAYLHDAVTALLAGRRPDPASTDPYGCTIVRFEGQD